MVTSTRYIVVEPYRGANIVKVNPRNPVSWYYGVEIDGEVSDISLISIRACKNVIDTHNRRQSTTGIK